MQKQMKRTLQTLHPNASAFMVPAAQVLLDFRHPDITVQTQGHGEDFLVLCASNHCISAYLRVGQHTYFLYFVAFNKKPEFTISLSKGKLGLTELTKLSEALKALADLGKKMSEAIR